MQNVYDCVRPILLVMSVFGVGASKILKVDGVYSLENTRYSIIMAIFISICTPLFGLIETMNLFNGERRSIIAGVVDIVLFLLLFLFLVTVAVGCIMTRVCCKDLDKVFQIINNIDTKLQQENIKIKHWKITLAVAVLGLLTVNYGDIAYFVYFIVVYPLSYIHVFVFIFYLIYTILFHLCYVWVILFLLIIYERFVSINKLFLQNARVPNIRIIGYRNSRDNYLLRRISMARHLDEQLSQAIVLYTNVFRYIIAGLLLHSIVALLHNVIVFFFSYVLEIQLAYMNIFTSCVRIIIIIVPCQAYKEERQALAVRLRHLICHETDRGIIQQVQQYIMYNATSVTGLIDFQFTEVDNILLFTIIDIIVSNVLVIYSYAR